MTETTKTYKTTVQPTAEARRLCCTICGKPTKRLIRLSDDTLCYGCIIFIKKHYPILYSKTDGKNTRPAVKTKPQAQQHKRRRQTSNKRAAKHTMHKKQKPSGKRATAKKVKTAAKKRMRRTRAS